MQPRPRLALSSPASSSWSRLQGLGNFGVGGEGIDACCRPAGGSRWHDLDGLESVEDVELGHRDRVDAGDLDRVARGYGIEPAAATRAAGGGAEFGAALAHSSRPSHLRARTGRGRCRPWSHRPSSLPPPDRGTRGPIPHDAAANPGRHEEEVTKGVGAPGEVEHHTLGALEEDPVAGGAVATQRGPDFGDCRRESRSGAFELIESGLQVDRIGTEKRRQLVVVLLHECERPFPQPVLLCENVSSETAAVRTMSVICLWLT